MPSNSSIVLVGIALYLCSPLSGSLAAASPVASPAANKLLFGIASNEEICPVKNIIVESRYVKSCVEDKLPASPLNLTVEDPGRFLCLGVYDRIATLCYLDSFKVGGKSVLPENSTEFDNLVAKLPLTDKESFEFCTRSKNPYPPRYKQTKMYAEQLNKAMAMPGLCVKMCILDDGKFNRLCSVIAAIEDISLQVSSIEKLPKQETKDPAVKEKTVEHNAKADSAVEKAIPEKAKEAGGKLEDKAVPQTGPSADKKEAEKNKKQNKPLVQLRPQHTEPAPEVTKTAAIPPPVAPKETPQNKKEKKMEEPETAAKPPHSVADVGSDKKADVQPPTSKNPPIDPDDSPTSREDGEDGYLRGTDNIGQLQDNPINGVISEQTQELEDQDVGEEKSEIGERNNPRTLEATLNGLDPPPIPPNEQVEESPSVPSEKRELVPRMPSIRNDDDSHFFGYFTVIGVICIAGYVGYHNKQKILAMVLEGRRSRGGRGRRRPSTANYRKLDCTLEEAVTSQCNSNVTHVIY